MRKKNKLKSYGCFCLVFFKEIKEIFFQIKKMRQLRTWFICFFNGRKTWNDFRYFFFFFLLNVRELKDIHFLSFLIKKKIFFFNDFYSLFYFSLKILLFSSTLIIFYFLLCFCFSIFFSIFSILFLEFFVFFSSKFLVANSLKHWVSGKQY